MSAAADLPVWIADDADDEEVARLIESWRYTGPPTPWEAIVGHERQIARCQELVEKLARPVADLDRLHIRVGAGMVITGEAGVGKSLLARATATALGRRVVTPPTAELTAALIHRLYRQLGRMEPTVVILDEAEAIIGRAWQRTTDADALRALLAALDGLNQPQAGPITLALTTTDIDSLDASAIRPGRLAPHLVLTAPSANERRHLLERRVKDLPVRDEIDLGVIVERTAGWSGAELVTAVEEACARSLLDHTDALRMDLLLEVVGERYTVEDERPFAPQVSEAIAIHEAGHAVFGELTWPGEVAVVSVHSAGGQTRLSDRVERDVHSAAQLRRLAALSLAGEVAEQLVLGAKRVTTGASVDKQQATTLLLELIGLSLPYAVGILERGDNSDRGSDAMRAQLHSSVAQLSASLRSEVHETLAPHAGAIRQLARRLLDAPDHTLSGTALSEALGAVLDEPANASPSHA